MADTAAGTKRSEQGTWAGRSVGVDPGYAAASGREVMVGGIVGLSETVPDITAWIGWRLGR